MKCTNAACSSSAMSESVRAMTLARRCSPHRPHRHPCRRRQCRMNLSAGQAPDGKIERPASSSFTAGNRTPKPFPLVMTERPGKAMRQCPHAAVARTAQRGGFLSAMLQPARMPPAARLPNSKLAPARMNCRGLSHFVLCCPGAPSSPWARWFRD
jgi:hypothetical protein